MRYVVLWQAGSLRAPFNGRVYWFDTENEAVSFATYCREKENINWYCVLEKTTIYFCQKNDTTPDYHEAFTIVTEWGEKK